MQGVQGFNKHALKALHINIDLSAHNNLGMLDIHLAFKMPAQRWQHLNTSMKSRWQSDLFPGDHP